MKRIVLFLIVCLSLLRTYATNEGSINYMSARDLYAGSMHNPQQKLSVKDNKFNTTLPVVYNTNGSKGVIRLKIDQENKIAFSAYEVSINFKATYINSSQATVQENFSLQVKHDPTAATTTSQVDMQEYYIDDAQSMDLEITDMIFSAGSYSVSNIPGNLMVESEIQTERYYQFSGILAWSLGNTPVDVNNDQLADELDIHWNYIPGAEEYELEWIYVNDYAQDGSPIPFQNIYCDFRNNATKVRITNNFYRIPLVFDRGYLVYRVRAVGVQFIGQEKYDNFTYWTSIVDYGTLAQIHSSNNGMEYYYLDGHERGINWQYIATYAEEGKNKAVVNYMDPTFRSRQQVTKINTSDDIIVGETVYDFQGRAAINVLPVPSGQKIIQFYPNFNLNTNGNKYSWEDFDKNATSCSSQASAMKNTSGASLYYSPLNPDQYLQQSAIPDAGGFPFIQTEYTPDNTGKIKNQGGAGAGFQITSGAHYTSYLYGQPFQKELDRLFGSEAGHFEHYQKNAVIDPNGQVSVSYIDMYGKVIATALAGASPANLTALESNNSQSAPSITEEMLGASNKINMDGNGVEYSKDIIITANNTPVTLNYSFWGEKYNECLKLSTCYSCVYNLNIKVVDKACNNVIYTYSKKVGMVEFNNCIRGVSEQKEILLTLDKGSYTIKKSLLLDDQSINEYADKFMTDDNNCFTPPQTVFPDTSNCCWTCEKCKNTVEDPDYKSRLAETNPSWTTAQIDQYYADQKKLCKGMCEEPDVCSVSFLNMLSDVSPNGQYAEYKNQTTGETKPSMFKLSLLNENNLLGVNTSSVKNWKNPFSPYLDGNGNEALINVEDDPSQADDPANLVEVDMIHYVKPEHLSSVDLFVQYWQPSFAYSLVPYHPEYYYYDWCNKNNVKTGTFNGEDVSSNEFDRILENCPNTTAQYNAFAGMSMFSAIGSLTDMDPFFNSTNLGLKTITSTSLLYHYIENPPANFTGKTLMNYLLANYKYLANGTSLNIAQITYISSNCAENDYSATPGMANCDYASKTFPQLITAGNFKMYLNLYLLCKKKVQEIYADLHSVENANYINKVYNVYSGKNSGLFTPFYKKNDKSILSIHSFFSGLSSPTTNNSKYYNRSNIDFIQYGLLTGPWDVKPLWTRFHDFILAFEGRKLLSTFYLYKSKEKRFPKINDSYGAVGDKLGVSGDDDDEIAEKLKAKADYNFYRTTGQCPLARDVERFIDFVAKNYSLGSTMNVPSNNYSKLFYESLAGSTAVMNPCSWEGTANGTSLTANIKFTTPGTPPTTYTKLTLQLTNLPTGVSWASVRAFAQLQANASNQFTVKIKYDDAATNTVKEAVLSGSLTYNPNNIQLANCSFNDECTTNEEAGALSQLLGVMLNENLHPTENPSAFASTSYTSIPSSSGFYSVFEDMIMNTKLKKYFYDPDALGASYEVAINLSTKTFKIRKGKAELITVLSGTNSLVDGFFINAEHSSGASNQFSLQLDNTLGTISDYTAAVTYNVYYLGTSNSPTVLTFDAGLCKAMSIADCKSYFHDNFNELKSLLEKVAQAGMLTTSFNLFPGNFISEELLGKLGDDYDLKWEPQTTNDTLFIKLTRNNGTDEVCSLWLANNEYISGVNTAYSSMNNIQEFMLHPEYDQTNYTNYFRFKGYQGTSVLYILNGATQCLMLSQCVEPCYSPGSLTYNHIIQKTNFENTLGYTSAYAYQQTVDIATPSAIPDMEYVLAKSARCDSNYLVKDKNYPGSGHYMLTNTTGTGVKKLWGTTITAKEGDKYELTYDYYVCACKPDQSEFDFNVNYGSTTYSQSTVQTGQWVTNAATFSANADETVNIGINLNVTANTSNYLVIALDNIILRKAIPCQAMPDSFPTPPPFNPSDTCVANLLNIAANNAYMIAQYQLDSIRQDFILKYKQKCLSNLNEVMTYNSTLPEYHYTLYYYDQSGNLLKTVPPEGVSFVTSSTWFDDIQKYRESNGTLGAVHYPAHRMTTVYTYNSLNQLINQKTPDAGITRFWYDKLGRIVLSQNAQQLLDSKCSYTRYDELGRIVDVGQILNFNYTYLQNDYMVSDIEFAGLYGQSREQITQTNYDLPLSAYSGFDQQNLRNRVASVSVFKTHTDQASKTYIHTTRYDYDIHGNVKSVLQDFPEMGGGERVKRIDYEYDLVSGKVNQVNYQAGQKDQFYHRYEYDADNRLTQVYTSTDGKIWEKDAKYFYYKHGPLARTEIGDLELQGTDYAYTLQGWVKGINSTLLENEKDLGRDGLTGNLSQNFAQDAASYSLNYFNGDYTPINTNYANFTAGISSVTPQFDLYNGNIKAMATTLRDDNYTAKPQLAVYKYDQLNRIKQMQTYQSIAANAWGATTTNAYNETYTYDANGNIKTLVRYNGAATPVKIDELTYGYNLDGNGNLVNNKLNHIDDPVSSLLCSYDIDDQSPDNYLYDAIGNLTKDNAEEIDNIEWNAYGKISKITRTTGSQKSNLEFIYDAMGNRVCKIEKPYNLTSSGWKYTFYVRDASGNIMTTYTKTGSEIENNVLKLDEVMLYGSGRIGTREIGVELTNITIPTAKFSRTLGLKRYEIGNHLGNVLATFTDRKKQVQSGSSVTGYETYIASAQDYYPFGMIMNERKWNTSGYRFGFNGKEKDDETYGTGNEYDLGARIYNPRIGKMLSPDPRESEYPWQSTYAYYANTPTSLLDFDGEGDYYSKNGKHLGSDGRTKTVGKGKNAKQVADDKAYVSSEEIIKKYTNKEGVVDWDAIQGDKGTTDLTTKYGLSNTNLLNRANWAYGEGGGFYLDYYAHAINNLRKHGVWGPANKPYKSDDEMFKNKMTHKVNKKIINLYPGYFSGTAGSPSAQKFAKARGDLNTLTDDSKMRDAIGSIIGSIMGTTKDPTNGAYQWVGGEGTGGPLSKFPEKNNATNVTNVTSGKGKGMRYHTFYSILEE